MKIHIEKIDSGTWKVLLNTGERTYSCTTNNSVAVDTALDDDYDYSDYCGAIYETRGQALFALAEEVLQKNDVEMLIPYIII